MRFFKPNVEKMKARKDVEGLIKALGYRKDVTGYTSGMAAKALGEIGDYRAVEPLIAALKEGNVFFRCACVEALGRFGGDARAVEAVIAAFQEDEDDLVRRIAANVLQSLGWEQ